MNYLLDTNIVSEWIKPQPQPSVVEWVARVDEDRVFLSVASVAEIRRGIELLDAGRRREQLETWLENELLSRFGRRIIDLDLAVAHAWGQLMARAQKTGVGLSSMDAFIAATALARGLTLVTRNVGDFEPLGVALLNPWDDCA
jgi:predicted nucleic acid-binding protein